MGMTLTQKILASHAGLESVCAGELISARLDLMMGNDITAPVAVKEFSAAGFESVLSPERVVLVNDHFVPNKDVKAAEQAKQVRGFAGKYGIENFYDVGRMGIEHVLLPEQGLVSPGDLVIGADSHTCTYGALCAFSTGVGSTDLAFALANGSAWFKVPKAIRVTLSGALPGFVSGKDVILTLIGILGVDGARYMSLEFFGSGVASLSIDDRFTICNMAIECGAKNGIFPYDEVTEAYCSGRCRREGTVLTPDEDAEYEREISLDLSSITPTVAFPHLPENTHTALEAQGMNIRLDQAVIGSCTNGRISDLRAAASILKGRRVSENVRCIVIPGTQSVYLEALREGLIETFIEAGAAVSTPTCGPCLGGHMGILAKGERAISTTNRNFVGRMGDTESEVYLSSPATAAASAVTGFITCPEAFMGGEQK